MILSPYKYALLCKTFLQALFYFAMSTIDYFIVTWPPQDHIEELDQILSGNVQKMLL